MDALPKPDHLVVSLAGLSEKSTGRQTISLLVIQPTPFCNINCHYCYLANRSSKDIIKEATLRLLFAKLFASGHVGRTLDIAWHAGEPTVLPVVFYRRAFAILEEYRPASVQVRHSFQTNATLLNADWIALFRDPAINVGVSIDGPRHINDLNRLSRAGASTFDKAVAGIRLLRHNAITFRVITVLGPESLRSARALHDFYAAEGIEHVGFNIEESEGDHVSSLRDGAAAFGAFLAEFWAIAADGGRVKSIREIDNMKQAIFRRPPPGLVPEMDSGHGNMLTKPFSILSMDHRGNLSTFSPELLGQPNADYNDFVIGNIHTDSFADLPHSPVLARMHRDIQAGVVLCRDQCPYFHVCGGGEPVNKLAENGSFASTATEHCRMTRMAIADLMVSGPYDA
jgi:uncharacterized protein